MVRAKAEIGIARPGQILEIAREAAAQLAIKSPQLYADFLKGLLGNPGTPTQTVQTEDGGEPKKVTPTDGSILAVRIQKWKERCLDEEVIAYWQGVQDEVKKRLGPTAEVDKEILAANSEVDVKRYYRGRAAREELLKTCGLIRVPGGLAIDPEYVEKKPPAMSWMRNPLTEQDEKAIDENNDRYFREQNAQHDREEMAKLIGDVVAQQAQASDARLEKMFQMMMAANRQPSPPRPKPEGIPPAPTAGK